MLNGNAEASDKSNFDPKYKSLISMKPGINFNEQVGGFDPVNQRFTSFDPDEVSISFIYDKLSCNKSDPVFSKHSSCTSMHTVSAYSSTES